LNDDVLRALAVTAELTQTTLSRGALLAMESDLSGYSPADVLAALTRCRREMKGRLTVADVIERIEGADGRPSANEAWGIVLAGRDEAVSVVSNDEIVEAWSIAQPILDAGDEVGARMAFRDSYERITRAARDAGRRPQWFPSLGTDPRGRDEALQLAVRQGRITQQHAAGLLPAPTDPGPIGAALFDGQPLRLADLSPDDRERARRNVAKLKLILSGRSAA
jgi:hypothetical protein